MKRRSIMRKAMFWTLIITACLVSPGQAQTVTGSGTTSTVPIFTGSSEIGNSPISQLGGSTSIGATNERVGTTFQVITDSTIGPQPGQGPDAIYGEASGNADFTAGIAGFATSTTGNNIGVAGVTFSPTGQGVSGNNTATVGGGGSGVFGVTSASSGAGNSGVFGAAIASTGTSVGVVGQTYSPNGIGGLFDNAAGGNILVGGVGQPAVTVFRVDGKGTVFADGGFRPHGADFAEAVQVNGDVAHYTPGDLLVIDASGERRLSLSQTPYSTLVAGIYSTQPGVLASQHRTEEALSKSEVPLAVVGIVPCKVSAENGPIEVGDLLVASSTSGHAMKGTDRSKMLGAVVGKALQPLREGKGVVQVLVTLQ
jgi:hypothetical protein